MPIETSPIPFGRLQLPYTPLFDPTAHAEIAPNGTIIGGGGGEPGAGMGMGSMLQPVPVMHGPASVAASAIIEPTPGGVAGPHRAIPALPDAGYTAPTLRAASITGYPHSAHPGLQRGFGAPGDGGSVYAGASLYGSPQHSPYLDQQAAGPIHHPQNANASVYSDGWSASLPAPRRAPIAPLQHAPHHQSPHTHISRDYCPEEIDRGRRYDRSPSSPRSPPRNRRATSEIDDAASDASYYGMPRVRRASAHHRSPSQGSSASELSSPDLPKRGAGAEGLHRRTLSMHKHRSPSMTSADHEHSPVSPSPLRAIERQAPGSSARRSSLGLEDGLGLAGLEVRDECRARRASYTPSPHRSHTKHGEQRDGHSGARPGMQRQKSNLRPAPEGSYSDSETSSERRRSVRERSTSRLRRRSKDDADISVAEASEGETRKARSSRKSPEEQRVHEGEGRVRRVASVRKAHHGGHKREDGENAREQREESPYHRPHLPVDHSALLSPLSALDYPHTGSSRSRRHSHDHRHHFEEHQSVYGYEHGDHQYPDQYPQTKHRRANSEASHHLPQQQQYAPPPLAGTVYPGQSASVIGGGYLPHQLSEEMRRHTEPYPGQGAQGGQALVQMMGSPGQGFEDAASAAGTGMTFMDAPMGGRVSQYGLPKYAHNPKVDYRRFCVQRGNADVFID